MAIERRVPDPLLPFRIFRVRTVVGADLGMLALAASMFGMVFFVTLYLQEVLRLSPIQTGLAWLPMTACIATSAQLATRFVGRVGVKPLFVGGLLLAAGGMALLSGVSAGGSYAADALPGLVCVSLGVGLAFTTSNTPDACVAELRRRKLRALVHRPRWECRRNRVSVAERTSHAYENSQQDR